jgi:hypothetical protein
MIRKWEIDDATVITVAIGAFGKATYMVNGQPGTERFSTRKKLDFQFSLPDGRSACFAVRSQFGTRSELTLSVNGQLMVESGKKPFTCSACSAIVKPNDRFCGKCGHEMPAAEIYIHRSSIKKATNAIYSLAAMFALFGLVAFFGAQQVADSALARLSGMDDAATYSQPVHGVTYTVGELRKKIVWEARSPLLVNMILAAVMLALALWGRRAPLPAVLIATATFAVVIVTNAIANPATLGQGIILKIVVIALLFRGIKAALALRTADA